MLVVCPLEQAANGAPGWRGAQRTQLCVAACHPLLSLRRGQGRTFPGKQARLATGAQDPREAGRQLLKSRICGLGIHLSPGTQRRAWHGVGTQDALVD